MHFSVKEAVFPFNKFPGVDVLLGPEMKSTGEVMGIDRDFGWAFAKSQAGAGAVLPNRARPSSALRNPIVLSRWISRTGYVARVSDPSDQRNGRIFARARG